MSAPTGIVADPRYLDHHMGAGHVESPRRLEAIAKRLADDPIPGLSGIRPREAGIEELEYVHAHEYVGFISGLAGRAFVALDQDTASTAKTWTTARLAAGGVLEAVDAVLDGSVRNAFALVRPPGHHAETNMAKGFCIFNNVAVAAEHLLRRRGLKRVLIADWDIHHGNGTQHAFYSRRDVLFFSTHLSPYYPGTGARSETGHGEGEGFTVNVPLRPGRNDSDYLAIYRNVLGPIADAFRPDFILVSAGFDIFAGDPLGQMAVTEQGFAALGAELRERAEALCGGKIVFVLEGGYDLEGLAGGVHAVLGQLAGAAPPPRIEAVLSTGARNEVAPVIEIQKRYWKF